MKRKLQYQKEVSLISLAHSTRNITVNPKLLTEIKQFGLFFNIEPGFKVFLYKKNTFVNLCSILNQSVQNTEGKEKAVVRELMEEWLKIGCPRKKTTRPLTHHLLSFLSLNY